MESVKKPDLKPKIVRANYRVECEIELGWLDKGTKEDYEYHGKNLVKEIQRHCDTAKNVRLLWNTEECCPFCGEPPFEEPEYDTTEKKWYVPCCGAEVT